MTDRDRGGDDKGLPPHEAVALESCPLFRVLRHRTPSSPICLAEVIHKSFTLSQVLLSSGGKSVILVRKKCLHVVVFLCLCT